MQGAGSGQAVQLMGCGVIGAALVLLVPVCCWQVVQVGAVICCGGCALAWSSGRPRGHHAGTDPAGRAGGRRGRWAKEKGQGRRRGVRCCSGLVCAGGCDLLRRVHPGAGGGRWWSASRFRCRVYCWRWHCSRRNGSSGQRSSASRVALLVLHPGRFWPFAGGVRFST